MNAFVERIVSVARELGLLERDAVCCGTVSVQQCVALQALLDGPHLVGGLAEVGGVSHSAMTRLVDGLERRGWVARERSEEDRRQVLVALTPAGRAEAQRLSGLTAEMLDDILGRIPAEKREMVFESIALLESAIREARRRPSRCC